MTKKEEGRERHDPAACPDRMGAHFSSVRHERKWPEGEGAQTEQIEP